MPFTYESVGYRIHRSEYMGDASLNHAFPSSWFNGASPMYSDLWILYPTDSYVNACARTTRTARSAPTRGPRSTAASWARASSAGYAGTVFEPIDAFKGDLARGQFYMSTRYFGEDGSWPGSGATDGAELLPWAATQYLAWSDADPVSWKERMRNGAVYAIQGNRNPFVDHPEFVTPIYDSNSVAAWATAIAAGWTLRLRPTCRTRSGATTIAFDLARRAPVALASTT